MCSWCFGFAPVLAEVRASVTIEVELVLGGLAPDDEAPMPEATREYVRSAWDAVEARTGASFNRDFWKDCVPRRSTWPACRAILAAEIQRPGTRWDLFAALQQAYYAEARNPSLRSTLAEVFLETVEGGDRDAFLADLDSDAVKKELNRHFARRDGLAVSGFPTLLLETDAGVHPLARGYATAAQVLAGLEATS